MLASAHSTVSSKSSSSMPLLNTMKMDSEVARPAALNVNSKDRSRAAEESMKYSGCKSNRRCRKSIEPPAAASTVAGPKDIPSIRRS